MQIEIITRSQVTLMIEEALRKQSKDFNRQIERVRKMLIEKPFKFKKTEGNQR